MYKVKFSRGNMLLTIEVGFLSDLSCHANSTITRIVMSMMANTPTLIEVNMVGLLSTR